MKGLHRHLQDRPRLAGALLLGAATAWLSPGLHSAVTRALLGWNVAVWVYLLLVGWMMLHAKPGRLRSSAAAQAEGAGTVLLIVIVASVVSLLGIVYELSAAKLSGAPQALPHLAFALTTVTGSWLLLPTVFALTYASRYYQSAAGSGLRFPSEGRGAGADTGAAHEAVFQPAYSDFLYFSFTIAVAAQTADVSVTSPAMRRLVLLQSLLSFAFNTAILAFSINIAAGMF